MWCHETQEEFFKTVGVINSVKYYRQIKQDENREVKLNLTRGQLLVTFSKDWFQLSY